jgi:hypothetical protein
MSYGFKFFNDSSELVLDNELVKPWFAGRATFVSAEVSSDIPSFSFTHADGITRNYVVYRITYTPPTVSNGVFYISLPPDSINNKAYNVANPFYSGNENIYVYAAANTDYLPVSSDIPEIYCFSLGQITTAGLGYGARLFNSSNQCVFDTTKSHLKIDPASSQFFDYYVMPNGNQQNSVPPTDYACYFLPNLETNKLTYIDSSNFKREKYLCFYNQNGSYLTSWFPKILDENKTGTLPFTGSRFFNNSTRYSSVKQILPTSIDHNPLFSNALSYNPGYNGGGFPAASYVLTLNPTITQEGYVSPIQCNVTTTNVPTGGQLRYTLSGTGVTASDFGDGLTNTFVVNNNTASFFIYAASDSIFEQTETVTMTITSVGGTALVGIPQSFSLKNSSFYDLKITPNVSSINEGESFTVTLTTLETSTSPRIVNYTLTQIPTAVGAIDQNFDSNDWVSLVTLGSGATVTSNRFTLPANVYPPSTSRTFNAKLDFRVDGPKKLRLSIDDNPSVFVDMLINDTSLEYSWSISGPSTINEGIEYTYNVTTAAPTGTRAIIGLTSITGASEDDIAQINGVNYVSGDTYYVTTTNGSGSFTLKFKADLTTEGNEAFTIFLDKDMPIPRTRLADLGFNVTLVDTSLTPINWSFSKITGNPTTALVREGTSLVVRVQSTNVPAYPYTIYYRIASGNGTSDSDTNFLTNAVFPFNITSTDQQVLFDIKEDNFSEGTEAFQITFYRDASGTDIITGLEWQIIDAISVSRSEGFVVEGQTQTLTITPNYLSYPYTVYGEITGGNANLTSADFISGTLLTETILYDNTPVTLQFTGVEDYTYEGIFGEVVFFDMYSDSGRTIPIGNSISWSMGDPQFVFSRSYASVDEGSNQIITISTNAVLPKLIFGKMTGTDITNSDFSSPPNSTIFNWNITATGQSIGLTMAPDLFTETNPETVTLTFYDDTQLTRQVGNTVTWDIADTSKTPPPSWLFTRDPNTATVDEGVSVTVTASSTYVPVYPTTIYYKIIGSGITTEDFSLGILQGSWSISDALETISFLIQSDQLTEGTEAVTITFYSDSGYTTPIGNQITFNIGDASKTTWTFARIPSSGTIDEGQSISFTATPSNILAPNTTIYYWLNGTGITSGDVVSASLEGSFNSNSGLILNMREDLSTENLETAGITFYSDSNRTIPIGNLLSWDIGDTSKTPPSYSLSVSQTSIDEGSDFSFTINSANVLNYPFTAYYRLSGTGITVDDTDFDPLLGSVSVTGPTVSFNINATADQYTEGNETLTFSLYSDSNRTVQLGNSVSIVLNDASKTTWTFARIPATGSFNETTNNSISFTATPSNPAQAPTTIYYWLSGTNILDGDFSPAGTLGSFTSTSGLTITMAADNTTENPALETVGITFYSNSSRTIQIGNTLSWDVNDSSFSAPVYSVYFFTPPGTVDEGASTYIGIDSSFIPTYPVTIYYKFTGTGITNADTNFATSGPVALTGPFTYYKVDVSADQFTEGNEILTVTLYLDSGFTTQLGTPASITISDTSKTTWSFTKNPSTGSIAETGSNTFISFSATPSNALAPAITVYYSVSGILASDLTSNSLTGSFNSSSGTTLTMAADTSTEGNETATINFYSDSGRTVPIGNSLSWIIEDTSISPPSYEISVYPNTTTYSTTENEGSLTYLRVRSFNVTSYPKTIYYRITGIGVTTSDTDLVTTAISGGIDGQIILDSADHYTYINTLADQLTEGTETLTFRFYTSSSRLLENQINFGPVANDNKITLIINDTSQTTWTFDRAPFGTINEGSSVQIYATPSNPSQGVAILYYSISGISASDITSGSLTGSFASTGAPSFTMTPDSFTDGPETATISFFKDSSRTISAGNSLSWDIGDISLSPPSYSFSSSPSTVNEGAGLTVFWSFSNVPSFPITLYYTISGTNVTAGDTSENQLQGSVTFPGPSGSFSFSMTADSFTEGTENATATWYTNAARTIQAGNAISWAIADTSTTPLPPITLSSMQVGYPTVGMTTIPRGSYFWIDVSLSRYNDTGSAIPVLVEYRVNSTGAWNTFETLSFPAFYTTKSTSLIQNQATGPAATLNVRATSSSIGGTIYLNLGW